MTIFGSDGDDLINGTNIPNIINGLGGNDTLNGGDWNDQLFGGIGNDVLDGGRGADTLVGGVGNDTYIVDDVGDQISESFTILDNADTVISTISWTLGERLENLTLIGDADINGTGNELDNNLVGNASNNILNGGEGNDFLIGLDGDDTLEGGAGADTLAGGAGNDLYRYVNTDDVIIESDGLTGGIDTVESLVSLTLGDSLENLILLGFAPLDNPINGTGNELDNTITGNDSKNILSGKQGNDALLGGGGDDRLVGGIGEDILTGGDGADAFYRWRSGTGVDTITDFQVGEDKLLFSARGFGGNLVSNDFGQLAQEQFTLGTSATTESDRFIYDTDTGNLFFDIDGTGDIAQVQIATLSSGLALSNADIYIMA
jgi:Ca2+-binding RTX toxin-like protein